MSRPSLTSARSGPPTIQRQVPEPELRRRFDGYFRFFPWDRLPADAEGFDLGCGTGRWARYVAPRVGRLHCIDPSERALAVAQRNLTAFDNCIFHAAAVDEIPLPESVLRNTAAGWV
jgi:SAM-dependent methyltransferase